MKKTNNILILGLLFIIIILSLILIYKIKSRPKYDKELYAQVYKEYEEILNERNNKNENQENINTEQENNILENDKGNSYRIIATISIPKINYNAPIISETTDEYLKIAPTKFFGPEPNEVGNFCILGHNYKSDQFFSNLYKLEKGDELQLADRKNSILSYKVYDKYEIDETDLSCTSQETNGKTELTLITCVDNKKKRLVIKCRAI